MAKRESQPSWRSFPLGLRERGSSGVELVLAYDHAGLGAAIRDVLSEAAYQRCDRTPAEGLNECLR